MSSSGFRSIMERLKIKNAWDLILYTIFILVVLKLFHLYLGINDNMDNWEEFKGQHHCVLGRTESGTQQATWLCDDGKTYYRWRQLR